MIKPFLILWKKRYIKRNGTAGLHNYCSAFPDSIYQVTGSKHWNFLHPYKNTSTMKDSILTLCRGCLRTIKQYLLPHKRKTRNTGTYHHLVFIARSPISCEWCLIQVLNMRGYSLNKVLLSGPDLNNTLLGALMHFRKEPVAFTADVQQIFFCFIVKEEYRDYPRLFFMRTMTSAGMWETIEWKYLEKAPHQL